MIRDVRARLNAVPFLPFVIFTSDGREYPVPTVDHAHVYPQGQRVSVYTDEGQEFILPGLMISGIQVGQQQTAP